MIRTDSEISYVPASRSIISSLPFQTAIGTAIPSLGASGAILAVLAMFAAASPDSRLTIVFLPMITVAASTGLKGLMMLDAAGIVSGWRLFDHAAHLGGALFGLAWFHGGANAVWGRREIFMTWWHENVRGGKKR